MKLLTQRPNALRTSLVFMMFSVFPATAYGLQGEPGTDASLWWVLGAAITLAIIAFIVGRKIGKRPSASDATGKAPPISPSQALPGPTGTTKTGTSGIFSWLDRSELLGLSSFNTLERWWVRIPAALRRYSAVLSTAWADGMYLTAWPRLAMLLSLLAAAFGVIEGASHWSLLTIDSTGSASAPAVAFAQILPLLVIAAAVGSLSANAGLMLVLGYAIGDYVFAGPQVQISGATSLPQFFYLRVPQLISYIFFFMLAAVPILTTKYLLSGLNRRMKGADIPSVVLRTVAAAVVQAALVYGWTLAAVMVIRIFWAWAGQYPPLTVGDYLRATDPWLPATAAAAVLLRGWLSFRARSDKALQTRVQKLLPALQEAERRPAFSRRLPIWARAVLTAIAMTMLMSGFIDSLFLGAIILLVFAAILLARMYVLPKLGVWIRWAGLVSKVPLPVRLASTILAGYVLTRLVLALPGQSAALNGVPGKFAPELVSIVLGLLVAVALLPQPSDAGAQADAGAQEGIAANPGAKKAAPPLGVGARVLLVGAFVLLSSSYAYAGICLDPVCCFGSDQFTALAVAGLLLLLAILLFWPELVLLGAALWPFIEPIFAIAAGAQGIIDEVMGTLLGDVLFPAPALPAARTVAEAFAETPPVIEVVAEGIAEVGGEVGAELADAGETELAAEAADGVETTLDSEARNALMKDLKERGLWRPLKDFMGGGADEALANVQNLPEEPPPGLTREALETYERIAQHMVDEGIDSQGTQAARVRLIDAALKKWFY